MVIGTLKRNSKVKVMISESMEDPEVQPESPVGTLKKSITVNFDTKSLEPRFPTENQQRQMIPGRSFAMSSPGKSRTNMGSRRSSFFDVKARLIRSHTQLADSVDFARLSMGQLFTKWIMLNVFSKPGVFIFIRIFPILNVITTPMLVFCPGGGSFCGDPGYGGMYYSASYIGIMTLILYLFCILLLCYQIRSYWVATINGIGQNKTTSECRRLLTKWFAVDQLLTKVEESAAASVEKKVSTSSIVVYIILCPFFFILTEIELLFSPFNLSTDSFFSDYEISRSILFGTTISFINLINASIFFAANTLVVPIIAVVCLGFNILLPIVYFAFIHEFSIDDKISFLTSWIINCKISNSQKEESDEIGESCPFYRTMKYREILIFNEKIFKYQIVQLVENLRVNWKLQAIRFENQGRDISLVASNILAEYIKNYFYKGLGLEKVNKLNLLDLPTTDLFLATPDERRVFVLWSLKSEEKLVVWNEDLRYDDHLNPVATDFQLFTLTAVVALNLLDPARLVEMDIGSNKLGDDVIPMLTRVLEEASNLVILEMGSNQFTLIGFRALLPSISKHAKMEFLRVSTVLLKLEEIRSQKCLDLSLPRLFSDGVERCVLALFNQASENEDLRGGYFEKGNETYDKLELNIYFSKLKSVLGDQYRLVGRDFYRSLPQGLIDLCIQRVAHRLGKLAIPDPGEELDLPKERIVDGEKLDEKKIQDMKLFPFILSILDIEIIARLLNDHNPNLEDFDMRGMPLMDPIKIMTALKGKRALSGINFSFCHIDDSAIMPVLLSLLKEDHAPLREVLLRGNSAFGGQKVAIWDVIGNADRKSHPRVVIDIPNAFTGSIRAVQRNTN